MAQTPMLRIVLAAIGSFVLFAAIFLMPFASLPLAAVGLAYGVTQAFLVALTATVITAIILTPPLAIVFAISFLLPTLLLVRQSLLSRAQDDGSYQFFPLSSLILLCLSMTGLGTVLIFLVTGGSEGLPQSFANAMLASPEIKTALMQVYSLTTDDEIFWVANIMLITGFAGWPLLLLGNMQIAQALLVKVERNLRPTDNYDLLQLPAWLIGSLGFFMLLAGIAPGWLATLGASLAAIVFAAYFLLGLAIIHAISRHWNGRGFILASLYFLIFVMAWLIIPISLMGVLDSRLNFRRLRRAADKPSDADGDKE